MSTFGSRKQKYYYPDFSFSTAKLIFRDNEIKIQGKNEVHRSFARLYSRCCTIIVVRRLVTQDLVHHYAKQPGNPQFHFEKPAGAVIYTVNPIIPRTQNQYRIVEAVNRYDLNFIIGMV